MQAERSRGRYHEEIEKEKDWNCLPLRLEADVGGAGEWRDVRGDIRVTREPGHWPLWPSGAWEHITRHAACHTRVTPTLASKHVTRSLTNSPDPDIGLCIKYPTWRKSSIWRSEYTHSVKFVRLPVFWWGLRRSETRQWPMMRHETRRQPPGELVTDHTWTCHPHHLQPPGLWKWCLPYIQRNNLQT